jgi:FSR family fosmidomycin resistance protein-like MFS transporter
MNEPSHRRATLLVAGAAHVLHDGFSASLYLLLPVWQAEFALSLAQVGMLRAAYTAAMASLQIPAGVLAERWGESLLLAAGTVIVGIAYLVLGAAASGFLLLALCLFLVGCGSSTQHPLASSLVARTYEGPSIRAAIGIYNFSGDIGKLVFPAVTALLLTLMPWRSVVVGYAGTALLVAPVVLVLLAALQRGQPDAGVPAHGQSVLVRGGWGIRDRRAFRILASIFVIDDATRTAFLTFAPFLLTAKGASVDTLGLALTLVFAGGAAGKFLCGVLAQRLGIIRTVVVTELVTGLGIVLLLALPLTPGLALLPLIGVALNGTSSVLYGNVAELVAPEQRARAFGLIYTLGSAAAVVAPVLYGVMCDRVGIWLTLATIGAVVLVTVPLTRWLPRAPETETIAKST